MLSLNFSFHAVNAAYISCISAGDAESEGFGASAAPLCINRYFRVAIEPPWLSTGDAPIIQRRARHAELDTSTKSSRGSAPRAVALRSTFAVRSVPLLP